MSIIKSGSVSRAIFSQSIELLCQMCGVILHFTFYIFLWLYVLLVSSTMLWFNSLDSSSVSLILFSSFTSTQFNSIQFSEDTIARQWFQSHRLRVSLQYWRQLRSQSQVPGCHLSCPLPVSKPGFPRSPPWVVRNWRHNQQDLGKVLLPLLFTLFLITNTYGDYKQYKHIGKTWTD